MERESTNKTKRRDSFKKIKESYLKSKLNFDKSKKGSIDKKILSLINTINSLTDFYTTSSCSGRIVILETNITTTKNKKNDTKWVYSTHELAKSKELIMKLKEHIELIETQKNKSRPKLIFKMEPAILHVASKSIEKAQKILDIARHIGFKRSGIFATKKRIMIEIVNTERIDFPIYVKNKNLIINNEFLEMIIKEANEKLKLNWRKINTLEDKLKELLK